jgi:hypothetical protein
VDKAEFLSLLKGSSEKEPSEQEEKAESPIHRENKVDKNPYSQDELNNFIKGTGFAIDPIANFTEMAKTLRIYDRKEPQVIDKVSLDEHSSIKDVSPQRKNDAREMEKLALRKLIAKYKG